MPDRQEQRDRGSMDAMKDEKYKAHLLQNVREHTEFLRLLRSEEVLSYLEIGSMYGGSLWRTANYLPKGSRIVSIDYMVDTPEAKHSLQACVMELNDIGYDAHLIFGDSASPEIIEMAAALGPYDCVFIDGAHTLEAVTNDWDNYGSMGRLVAFHDISWNDTWKSSVPGRVSKPMGVPELWQSLKKNYKHVEFQYQVPCNYYGIGVLWK